MKRKDKIISISMTILIIIIIIEGTVAGIPSLEYLSPKLLLLENIIYGIIIIDIIYEFYFWLKKKYKK